MDIRQVTVITCNPSGYGNKGNCEIGHYTVDGGLLTMVAADGTSLRTSGGERITARLAPGEDPRRVASRLKLTQWRNERAQGELVPGFNSPLHQSAPYGGY